LVQRNRQFRNSRVVTTRKFKAFKRVNQARMILHRLQESALDIRSDVVRQWVAAVPDFPTPRIGNFLHQLGPRMLPGGAHLDLRPLPLYGRNYMDSSVSELRLCATVVDDCAGKLFCELRNGTVLSGTSALNNNANTSEVLHLT
jgi:hypothetical protein